MEPTSVRGSNPICDFCNDPSVACSYEAAPVVMKVNESIVYSCDSKWAACAVCAQLIDENRWNELSDRSFELWVKSADQRGERPGHFQGQMMKAYLFHLHELFRVARDRTA